MLFVCAIFSLSALKLHTKKPFISIFRYFSELTSSWFILLKLIIMNTNLSIEESIKLLHAQFRLFNQAWFTHTAATLLVVSSSFLLLQSKQNKNQEVTNTSLILSIKTSPLCSVCPLLLNSSAFCFVFFLPQFSKC